MLRTRFLFFCVKFGEAAGRGEAPGIPRSCLAGWPLALLCVLVALAGPAQATVVYTSAFTSATTGKIVAVEAGMAISGDLLTITLSNNSPTTSSDPADVLSGFFFDLAGRPTLSYVSAVGTVANLGTNPNTLSPDTDIKAVAKGDKGWAFVGTFDNTNAWKASYGLGTAGFSKGADSFSGTIVGGLDYSIDSGTDVSARNLIRKSPLVYHSATFTLAGVSGLSDSAILSGVTFAFGTAPDAVSAGVLRTVVSSNSTAIPEPQPAAVFAGALLMLAGARRRVR